MGNNRGLYWLISPLGSAPNPALAGCGHVQQYPEGPDPLLTCPLVTAKRKMITVGHISPENQTGTDLGCRLHITSITMKTTRARPVGKGWVLQRRKDRRRIKLTKPLD